MPVMEIPPDAAAQQHQALHVLTLAQRTAEEHLNSARLEADRIRADAREAAAQIARDAQTHAETLQREAEHARANAHAAAAQIARDARGYADKARQDAEEILSEAQLRADEVAREAQLKADELQQLAQQRHDDVVGSLVSRREGLQQQIEALERFDRDYRARLQAFMQNQLRALWVEEPRMDVDGLDEPAPAALPPVPVEYRTADAA